MKAKYSRSALSWIFLGILTFGLSTRAHAQKVLSEGIKDLSTQIAADASKGQKKKIAVVPFRELGGQPTVLGTYISEELVTDLFSFPNLEIVERSLLDKVLKELKLGQSGAIDPDTAKQVGRLTGVDAIVTGTVTDLQSYLALNCRLIDAQSGRIFAAAQAKIVKDDDVKKILGVAMGGSESGSSGPGTIETATTLKQRVPSAENDFVRCTVSNLKKIGNTITLYVTFEAISEKDVIILLGWPDNKKECYLTDENGERWDIVNDSTGFFDRVFNIHPGAKQRSIFKFKTVGDPSGKIFSFSVKNNWQSNFSLVITAIR